MAVCIILVILRKNIISNVSKYICTAFHYCFVIIFWNQAATSRMAVTRLWTSRSKDRGLTSTRMMPRYTNNCLKEQLIIIINLHIVFCDFFVLMVIILESSTSLLHCIRNQRDPSHNSCCYLSQYGLLVWHLGGMDRWCHISDWSVLHRYIVSLLTLNHSYPSSFMVFVLRPLSGHHLAWSHAIFHQSEWQDYHWSAVLWPGSVRILGHLWPVPAIIYWCQPNYWLEQPLPFIWAELRRRM
jgi:hypothetical protein